MGYYPAPPDAIASILPRLVPPSDPSAVALLDPCAGEGHAIQGLARGLGVPDQRVWLVELDRQRGEACRATLPGATLLTPCSFLSTDIRRGSYSLLYANPPFDDALVKHTRVEEQFLAEALPLLVTGGVLVFVCPESIIHRGGFQGLLTTYTQNVAVVPFPAHCRQHQEVFVLAQRIAGFRQERCAWRDILAATSGRYAIPKAPGPGARFKKTGLTDEELADYLDRSTLLDEFSAPSEPVSYTHLTLPTNREV